MKYRRFFIFIVELVAIPALQFLLFKKKHILDTDTDSATNTEKNLLQKSNES